MTAPSLISVTATSYSTTGVLSKATASISVTAGDILVAKAAMESGWNTGSAADVNITVSDSAGNTWTRKQELAHTGASADDTVSYVTAWTAVAAATGSTTVTFAQAGATNTAKHFGGEVDVWRGSDGVGATNVANNGTGSGAPSVGITTTQDNSALSVIDVDWNATTGTDTWTTTAGTPINRSDFSDGASYGAHTATYADVGATGSKTVGMSAPATQRYGIIVVEIKGTAAASTVVGMPRGGRLFAPNAGPTRGLRRTQAFPPLGTIYSDGVTEAASATDAVSASAVFAASDTEAGSATDTVAATAVFAPSITEAGTAADAPSATAIFAPSDTEAASATDTVSNTAVFAPTVSEAGTAADTVTATAVLNDTVTEAATAADAPSARVDFAVTLSEAGTATDTVSATGQVFNVDLTEAASATDTDAATVDFAATSTEAATASDAPSAVAVFQTSVTEAGTAADATDGAVPTVYNVSVTEAANATDTLDGTGSAIPAAGGQGGSTPIKKKQPRPRFWWEDELKQALDEVAAPTAPASPKKSAPKITVPDTVAADLAALIGTKPGEALETAAAALPPQDDEDEEGLILAILLAA